MKKYLFSIIFFLIVYSLYVTQFQMKVENYSDVVVAVTFFFTLFSGFFITRQNDRFTSVVDEISNNDGLFSLLYRISGVVPRVQDKVRDAIREHYQKIMDSDNWAYHVLNPSNTITRLFKAYSEVDDDEREKLGQFGDAFGGAFASLQVSRKKILMLYHQRLLPLQWSIIIILAVMMVVSFDFIPSDFLLIDVLKVFFSLSVVLVVLLLVQLDNLTLFGEGFNKKTANDIFRILDEKDASELGDTNKK